MPKYDFHCDDCDLDSLVERPMSEGGLPFICVCGETARRVYVVPQIITQGESIPFLHPALGCVVKSDSHARKLAKAKGWTEIGNEDPNKYAPTPKRHNYEFNDYFLDNGSING